MHDLVVTLKDGLWWQGILEIAILSFMIYKLLLFIKATIAIQVLKGIGFFVILAFISRLAELHIINSIIWSVLGIGAIGVLIVFQPELRRALARVGHRPMFHISLPQGILVEEMVESVNLLASRKRGALLVLERNTGLEDLIETGVRMNSDLSSEVLDAIFMPQGALHDGAVVIREGRIAAAACIISIGESNRIMRSKGTRHLAGMSLSQETDAIVIVVSEETGEISVAVGGEMKHNLDGISLRNTLRDIYLVGRRRWWSKGEMGLNQVRKANG